MPGSSSRSYSIYRLNVVLDGGEQVSLLSGQRRADQALFIEREIEKHLGIEDYRVGVQGEIANR